MAIQPIEEDGEELQRPYPVSLPGYEMIGMTDGVLRTCRRATCCSAVMNTKAIQLGLACTYHSREVELRNSDEAATVVQRAPLLAIIAEEQVLPSPRYLTLSKKMA